MNSNTGTPRASRLRNVAGALLACSLLSSCATFLGPRNIEVPLHKLQAGLERRFPVDDRFLELFDIHLSRPQLALHPERERVAVTVAADITPPFLRTSYRGSIEFSGRPYVDTGRNAVYIAEPHVDSFELDGVDPVTQRQLTKVANFVMDRVIRDVPVYTFRMEDLRYGGVQFVPTRITTTSSGLVVRLEPVK
jgi:hypothetical protein